MPKLLQFKKPGTGSFKRRARGLRGSGHCWCGAHLRSRRGVARCPFHGTSWAAPR